jgi:hypothetical protein
MKPGDIDAGLKLCRDAKWNQLEMVWQLFLQLSPTVAVSLLVKKELLELLLRFVTSIHLAGSVWCWWTELFNGKVLACNC